MQDMGIETGALRLDRMGAGWGLKGTPGIGLESAGFAAVFGGYISHLASRIWQRCVTLHLLASPNPRMLAFTQISPSPATVFNRAQQPSSTIRRDCRNQPTLHFDWPLSPVIVWSGQRDSAIPNASIHPLPPHQ